MDETERGLLDRAVELHDGGDPAGASRLLDEAANAAESRHGAGSVAAAGAWHDRARLAALTGDLDAAVEALRKAIRVDGSSEEGRRDGMTYRLDLGRTLTRRGELEEASCLLGSALAERERDHGADQPGAAVALEALAELDWARGDLESAASRIEKAVRILWEARDPQSLSAVGLRAGILASLGRRAIPFAPAGLGEEEVEDLVAETCRHLDGRAATVVAAALGDLIDWVGSRPTDRGALLIELHADRAEAARMAGDDPIRRESLAAAAELADGIGDDELALRVSQAMALAFHESGDLEEAEETYREAADRAESAGLPASRSNVLRNYGLFLAETERDLEAEAVLRESLAVAEACGDADLAGRSLTALGIFLQHDHRLAEARPMLLRAVGLMGEGHADVLLARGHLQAIDRGTPCGCGRQEEAFATMLRQLVEPRLPPGLIASIRLDPEAGVALDLTREPSEAEARLLDSVIQESLRKLQKQIDDQNFR